jgi:hypothetical protein
MPKHAINLASGAKVPVLAMVGDQRTDGAAGQGAGLPFYAITDTTFGRWQAELDSARRKNQTLPSLDQTSGKLVEVADFSAAAARAIAAGAVLTPPAVKPTAPAQAGQAAQQPALFSAAELATWNERIGASRAAKDYEAVTALLNVFSGIRLQRAAQHPARVADALLVLVGSRGSQVPNLDDVFTNVGRGDALSDLYGDPEPSGVKVAKELPAHDTPQNRRLLHGILAGLLEMPTTVAGSGAVRYFLGTGSFAGKDKAGVGLLSSSNAWAKEIGWKNDDSQRVIASLFEDHYGSGDWNGLGKLLTQPKGGFQGYPEGELWDAAYASRSGASPFAMTHSERNRDFIGKLMSDLEARGLGPELDYAAPKLAVKLTPSAAKKAFLARFEEQWDAAIVGWNQRNTEFKIEGNAKDQTVHVWERAAVTRDGVKEQVQTAGGDYGHFQAVVVTTPEGEIKDVFALDTAKVKARRISKDELKDPSRPWLDRV